MLPSRFYQKQVPTVGQWLAFGSYSTQPVVFKEYL